MVDRNIRKGVTSTRKGSKEKNNKDESRVMLEDEESNRPGNTYIYMAIGSFRRGSPTFTVETRSNATSDGLTQPRRVTDVVR